MRSKRKQVKEESYLLSLVVSVGPMDRRLLFVHTYIDSHVLASVFSFMNQICLPTVLSVSYNTNILNNLHTFTLCLLLALLLCVGDCVICSNKGSLLYNKLRHTDNVCTYGEL